MFTAVDGCNFKRERNSQESVNDDSSRTRGHSPYMESRVDEYEDVDHLGSDTGDYHQLDPVNIGVPEGHVYSALDIHPYRNV